MENENKMKKKYEMKFFEKFSLSFLEYAMKTNYFLKKH